jgi:hypothetical protein
MSFTEGPAIPSLVLGRLSRDEYALNLSRECNAVERAPRFGYRHFGMLRTAARPERKTGALTRQKITPLSQAGSNGPEPTAGKERRLPDR